MRSLVTVQEVKSVTEIPGADRIEVVEILGWRVIVGKGSMREGDQVLYFEVDSLLPETDPRFQSFQKRGVKTVPVDGRDVRGHVLRTMKMQGVISQGLAMPLDAFKDDIYHWMVEQGEASSTDPNWRPHVGMDVTEAVGVVKYEEPIPVGGNMIGRFDTRYSPKSDAERVQSLSEHWDEIVSLNWDATVKVDGTSVTLINDEGDLRVFSRNWELERSSSAHFEVADRYGLPAVLLGYPGMAVQFEFAGPGIQKNRLKLSEQRPFVFAVFQDGEKIPRDAWPVEILSLAAPILGPEWAPSGSLEEMIEKVSGLRGSITRDILDEGIVYHLASGQSTPNWLDRNGNFKIINNKYLMKHGI